MTLAERLLNGEVVEVVGRDTKRRFSIYRKESVFGIYFLCAKRGPSRIWNSESAQLWLAALEEVQS